METSSRDGRYWAFISYSQRDSRWADWLHASLERYRVPKRLIGIPTPHGPAPRRLFPVFRDRDELAASTDLDGAVRQALQESRSLVVICSPQAAASQWVNAEVVAMQGLGRRDQIFCLIASGEPHASERGHPGDECFPLALRRSAVGETSAQTVVVEPLAADVRLGGQSKRDAILKLVAGILGIGFDELKRRDQQRRTRQFALIAIAAVATSLAITLLLVNQSRALTQLGLQRETNRRASYFSEIASAQEKYLNNDLAGARAELEASPVDLRHWEWYYLSNNLSLPEDTRDARADVLAMSAADGRTAVAEGDAVKLVAAGRGAADVRLLTAGRKIVAGAFSTDGARSGLVDADGLVSVHAAASGEEVARLATGVALFDVAVSRDARSVLGAFGDWMQYRVARWNLATGTREVLLNYDGEGGVEGLEFGPDDNTFIVRTIGSGNLATSALTLYTLSGKPRFTVDDAEVAHFAPDGKSLVVGNGSGQVAILDAVSGRIIEVIGESPSAVTALALSPDGRLIASGDASGLITVWQPGGGAQHTLRGHTDMVTAVAFTEGDIGLLSRDNSGLLKRWNLNRGGQRQTVSDRGPTNGVAIDPSGSKIYWANNFRLFETEIGGRTRPLLDGSRLSALHVGSRRVVGGPASDDDITTLQLRSFEGATIGTLDIVPLSSMAGLSASFSADGRRVAWTFPRLYTPPPHQRVGVADTQTGLVLLARDDDWNGDLALSPDGRLLAAARSNGTVSVWNVDGGEMAAEFSLANDSVSRLLFSPSGRHLLVGGLSRSLLWDLGATQATTIDLGVSLSAAAFRPDGSALAGSVDKSVRVWDVTSGMPIGTAVLSNQSRVIAFHPDGSRLIAGDAGGSLTLFETANWTRILTWTAHSAAIEDARFDVNGILATYDTRGTVSVWDGRNLSGKSR